MQRFDLERPPTDLLPRGLPVHTLRWLLLVCTTQLSSRLLDELPIFQEDFQSHGIIRTHTRDRVSHGLSTAEGLARELGNEGGRTLHAPASAGRVSPLQH
jgi:hypothetical protein